MTDPTVPTLGDYVLAFVVACCYSGGFAVLVWLCGGWYRG